MGLLVRLRGRLMVMHACCVPGCSAESGPRLRIAACAHAGGADDRPSEFEGSSARRRVRAWAVGPLAVGRAGERPARDGLQPAACLSCPLHAATVSQTAT
jgi:hypothetical protein